MDGSYRPLSRSESRAASRRDWDLTADEYQATHGEFLGDAGFVWCPEGIDEGSVGLLGDVRGRRVLEVGCGAGQCARWLRAHGATVAGLDLSERQLQHSRRIDDAYGTTVPVVCATATAVPFADSSFDDACSAFGALPFVEEVDAVMLEVARLLRPGGRWVFSVVHPMRWGFPDDPSAYGLRMIRSYFDRTPYVETDDTGTPSYVEHHHTIGDWVRAIVDSGFELVDLLEPEWPPSNDRVWGAWGPERGRYLPGTAIFSTRLRRVTKPG